VPKEPLVIYLFNPFGEKVIRGIGRYSIIPCARRRATHLSSMPCHHRHCFDRSPCLEKFPLPAWAKTLDRLTTRWPMAIYRARTFSP